MAKAVNAKGAKKAPAKASVKSAKKSSSTAKQSTERARVYEPEIVDPNFDRAIEEEGSESSDPSGRVRFTPEQAEQAYELARSGAIDINPDVDDVVAPVTAPQPKAKARKVTAELVAHDNDASAKSLTTVDPIATYLAEIRKYPLLTKEQERELAVRYRETGDARAAELLVTSNLRFVVKVAAEYSRFGAKLIDLVQEGNVGLMHAVREFNPYKGVRLITYAVWWIRGYIQEYLMRQYSMVRIGTTQNQRKLFYRLQKEKEKLDAAGLTPTVALLAGRLGVTEEEVVTMQQRLSGRDVSLNTPLDDGAPASTLLDFEADEHTPVDEDLGHREELDLLRDHLNDLRPTLNEKELFILENRLLADEPLTLQEIGDKWGVTREAVRQLEARLIGKIRKAVVEDLD